MKIYTDNVNLEMTIEEFENVLNKGILDVMINAVASLSTNVEIQRYEEQDEEIASILNAIFHEGVGVDELENILGHNEDYDEEEDDEPDSEELDDIEEQNDTVDRIYYSMFRNGERYREE